MVTLNELCADMASTGRSLTERGARDWWTKGLLPKPRRRGLGRGRGTETFWIEPEVKDQARAAYDFLSLHSRTYSALVALWLSGFPVDLTSIRAVYRKLISRNLCSIRGPNRDAGDIVGDLAAKLARGVSGSKAAPADVRNAVTDLALPFLELFFASDTEFTSAGLADLWTKAAPHLMGRSGKWTEACSPTEKDIGDWAQRFSDWISLPAQQAAIVSASDYEMYRARRVVHYVFGHMGRLARAVPNEGVEQLDEFCRRLVIVLGRPAVPILIMILRNEVRRRNVISMLLEFGLKLRSSPVS